MIPGYAPFLVAIWLFLWGLYGIVTSRHFVHLIVCVGLLQTSTYLLLAGVGYRKGGIAPVMVPTTHAHESVVDPIVQALMLTDVVVEATVMALLLAMAVQMYEKLGSADPQKTRVLRG
jgi:multicomponent Na+:H+ antiporter subunit C